MATKPHADSVPPVEPTVPTGPTEPSVAREPPVAPQAPAAPAVDPYATATATGPAPYGTAPYGYAPQPGQPYAPGYYAPAPSAPRGLSIASMVLGIVGVLFGLGYGLGLFPAIAAVITGHLAQRRQPAGKGFWIAGLVCGYVGILFSLIGIALLVFIIVLFVNGASQFGTDTSDLGFN